MKSPNFEPMRSLIFVDVAKEDYRIKLENWLYRYHIQDSISQFGPYVSKYAFYAALPVPPGGERYGTYKMQLTEHYWLVNFKYTLDKPKALTEFFPKNVLKWQGNIPDDDIKTVDKNDIDNIEGDSARSTKGYNHKGTVPFIFAFIPVWWEDDFKGKERTVEDGPNYRWQFVIKYPEKVNIEKGDIWFKEEFIPAFKELKETTRILSSKVMKDVNNCEFDRVVEIWFECQSDWLSAVEKAGKIVAKPSWAQTEDFPYLTKYYGISSMFLSDIPKTDNLTQYRGYITMR